MFPTHNNGTFSTSCLFKPFTVLTASSCNFAILSKYTFKHCSNKILI